MVNKKTTTKPKKNIGKIVMGVAAVTAGGIATAVALKNKKKIVSKAKEVQKKLSEMRPNMKQGMEPMKTKTKKTTKKRTMKNSEKKAN